MLTLLLFFFFLEAKKKGKMVTKGCQCDFDKMWGYFLNKKTLPKNRSPELD
jgi:hypothetical protein